ncbi:hypothetical protein WHT83_17060 [Aminobacter sp. P9b]|uniref:Uncharacterized protein n=1 Tax=Aminobacter niigataensis TaxID=83265 RepID=A0ABR6KXC1_9HYPH|nr:hypothetical protein [Aminobacter niigataensis]MBB4649137.1 hypothetical protein [Aminobacter niigataensis]
MKTTLGYALVILAAMSSSSFANSGFTQERSTLDRLLQGHGTPGEAATSVSNPDISYRVREDGKLVKTNSRYGTAEVVRPNWWFGMTTRERESRGLY